jgi:hypothetical protein
MIKTTEMPIGFDSMSNVDGISSIKHTTEEMFTSHFVIIPESVAEYFDILDIVVDGESQLKAPIPAAEFSEAKIRISKGIPKHVESRSIKALLPKGKNFSFVVRSKSPKRFLAAIIGTMDGKPTLKCVCGG